DRGSRSARRRRRKDRRPLVTGRQHIPRATAGASGSSSPWTPSRLGRAGGAPAGRQESARDNPRPRKPPPFFPRPPAPKQKHPTPTNQPRAQRGQLSNEGALTT